MVATAVDALAGETCGEPVVRKGGACAPATRAAAELSSTTAATLAAYRARLRLVKNGDVIALKVPEVIRDVLRTALQSHRRDGLSHVGRQYYGT